MSKRDQLRQSKNLPSASRSQPDKITPIQEKKSSNSSSSKHKQDNDAKFISVEVVKSPIQIGQTSVSHRGKQLSKPPSSIQFETKQNQPVLGSEQDPATLQRRKTLFVADRSRSAHHFRQVQLQSSAGTEIPKIPEPPSFIRSTGKCQRIWSLFSTIITCWYVNSSV
jgi:hypothetical protein